MPDESKRNNEDEDPMPQHEKITEWPEEEIARKDKEKSEDKEPDDDNRCFGFD